MRKFLIPILFSFMVVPLLPATAPAAANSQFQAYDYNKDGFIYRKEWKGEKETFIELDTNQDGQISLKEFTQNKSGDRFSELDRNRDGSLTLSEFKVSAAGFEYLDANHNQKIDRAEYYRSGRYRKVDFLEIDADSDGSISAKEWLKKHLNADYFRAMDKNKDGMITEYEFNQFYNSSARATQLFEQLFND